jgi:hypothetical protein
VTASHPPPPSAARFRSDARTPMGEVDHPLFAREEALRREGHLQRLEPRAPPRRDDDDPRPLRQWQERPPQDPDRTHPEGRRPDRLRRPRHLEHRRWRVRRGPSAHRVPLPGGRALRFVLRRRERRLRPARAVLEDDARGGDPGARRPVSRARRPPGDPGHAPVGPLGRHERSASASRARSHFIRRSSSTTSQRPASIRSTPRGSTISSSASSGRSRSRASS